MAEPQLTPQLHNGFASQRHNGLGSQLHDGVASLGGAGAGDSAGWPHLVDLRAEFAEHAPQLVKLAHPLPARVVTLAAGSVEFGLIDHLRGDYFGLMPLDGLLLAKVDAGRARTGWLFGAHDLIRPSGMRDLVLTDGTRWSALVPTRVALLDHEFGLRAGGIPAVSRVLLGLATRTSAWLFAKSLIVSSPAVEERLLLLFALFGERWGRVTAEGVMLRLPLTHAMLAILCGVRRPSVTMALHSLERDGLLSVTGKGCWLLHPCQSGRRDHKSCPIQYERSLGLSWSATAPRAGDGAAPPAWR